MSLPMNEEWRPVPGYEGHYEVSDQGRVRSLDRIVKVAGHSRRQRGQVLSAPLNVQTGRRQIHLSCDGRRSRFTVYSLVLTAFVGPRPPGTEGCHNDGDCTNDRLDDLRWDTHGSNNLDAVRHGTHNNARKTHCKRGHELTGANLAAFALARGKRQCLTCVSARNKARDRRRISHH